MTPRTFSPHTPAPLRFVAMRGAVVLFLLIAGCSGPQTPPTHESVTIRGHTFNLELAITDEARTQGLMHRETIAENGGMLFVFPRPEVRSFWMANCLVDIDIIFLDARGRITAMHRMKAEPPRAADESEPEYQARMPPYWSGLPAQFAIELRAGWLDRLELRPEERIELDLERLKALLH